MTDIELALIHYDGNGDMPYVDLVYQGLKLLQKQKQGCNGCIRESWQPFPEQCNKCRRIGFDFYKKNL